MSDFIPKVLIFGHSFVRRLHDDLVKGLIRALNKILTWRDLASMFV